MATESTYRNHGADPDSQINSDSEDVTASLIAILKQIVPAAFNGDELLMDKLQSLLDRDAVNERYHLDWVGKAEAYRELQSDITDTLSPHPEKSLDWQMGDHVLIEGDNLKVLKILQWAYSGKIKLIYIDPPYNTGTDRFIYRDKFHQSREEYAAGAGETNGNGNLSREGVYRKNNRESGRFHSNWLNMMLPRLHLGRNLLAEDGIMVVSIDDNEQANLKLLLDEIFGADNFIGLLPRLTKKSGKSTESLAKNHDYLLVYGKSEKSALKGSAHHDSGFSNKDEFFEERGYYKLNQTLDYNTLGYVKSLDYEIEIGSQKYYAGSITRAEWLKRRETNPKDGFRWRWSKELFEFGLQNGFIVVRGTGRIYTKTYQNCSIAKGKSGYEIRFGQRTKPVTSIDFLSNEFSNDQSRKNIVSLFGEAIFDYSKPVELIRRLIEVTTGKDDIVLDFFAGSGTTAEAVLRQNVLDGMERKFICVQLAEEITEDSLAFQKGFRAITDITMERIRRSIELLHPAKNGLREKPPGCRYFVLTKSNIETWDGALQSGEEKVAHLRQTENKEAAAVSILWDLLIKSGYPLNAKVNTVSVSDGDFHIVEDGSRAFLLNSVGDDVLSTVVNMAPETVAVLDSLFQGNDRLKENFRLQLQGSNIRLTCI